MVSIVTTCKGRLHHLRETIKPMIQSVKAIGGTVVVVDYDDPDNSYEYVLSTHKDEPVLAVKVDDCPVFNPSHARNIGGTRAPDSVLAFVDADVFVTPDLIDNAARDILNGALLAYQRGDQTETMGTCVVLASAYHSVRGYDEGMEGWGFQDCDFYRRVRQLGGPVSSFDPDKLSVIHNDDEERTKFYADKSKARTNARNHRKSMRRKGDVNPEGYGLHDKVKVTRAW